MYLRARRGISYLPQEPSVFRKMSVEDNLRAIFETLDLSHAEQERRVDRLLEDFGLQKVRRSPGYALSGGERRRVEIARALVMSPSFVLLTAGLGSALFGLTWWLVDVRGRRTWTGPFVTYGRNAIAVYVGSEVLSGALGTIAWASAGGRVLSLAERIHQVAFASWLPPMLAAFAFAFANVVLWWAFARWMDRRGIYLKV